MNNCRKLFVEIGAGVLAVPFASFAQQPGKVWRVGFSWAASRSSVQGRIDSIFGRLREFGYVEGRDLTAEHRWADGNSKLLAGSADT